MLIKPQIERTNGEICFENSKWKIRLERSLSGSVGRYLLEIIHFENVHSSLATVALQIFRHAMPEDGNNDDDDDNFFFLFRWNSCVGFYQGTNRIHVYKDD